MPYDDECYRLAKHFLADEPNATESDADALAQHIQTTIEDWLNFDQRSPQRQRELAAAGAIKKAAPDLYLTMRDRYLQVDLKSERALKSWFHSETGFTAFFHRLQPKTSAEHNAAIRKFIEREGLRAEDGEL